MEIAIIQLFIKGLNENQIYKLLDTKYSLVVEVIKGYKESPYIIRNSKMNYEN